MKPRHRVYTGGAIAAIDRLIEIADGDSEQGGPVARFLLAWWDADRCGGFDLTDLQAVDAEVLEDMTTVFHLAAQRACSPEALGYRTELERLSRPQHQAASHPAGSFTVLTS